VLYGTYFCWGNSPLGSSKKSVLVIDDDKSVLRTFIRILERGGYEVNAAETGAEALEKESARYYDVVLIDFRLPDMDGTEFLAKSSNLQNSIKIIITGLPSLDSGTNALEQGADAYLIKPVRPEELMALLSWKLKTNQLK
jgi:DNA-binding response OmpR family regulator